ALECAGAIGITRALPGESSRSSLTFTVTRFDLARQLGRKRWGSAGQPINEMEFLPSGHGVCFGGGGPPETTWTSSDRKETVLEAFQEEGLYPHRAHDRHRDHRHHRRDRDPEPDRGS